MSKSTGSLMGIKEVSIVRQNLMERRGYSPYCGADKCRLHWPRTTFDGKQFFCSCGWKSNFPVDFIDCYINHWREQSNGNASENSTNGKTQAHMAMSKVRPQD